MGSGGESEEQSFFEGDNALEVPLESDPDPLDCAMIVCYIGPVVYSSNFLAITK